MWLDYVGTEPTRAHLDDAGLDLYVKGNHEIPPGTFQDIDLGISIKAPKGHWTMLVGRSSTLRARGLLMGMGIIDSGYTGPLYAGAFNITKEPVIVKDGERIAQLIVFANATEYTHPRLVRFHEETSRGAKGFGSSGR